jgi:predicted GNAT family acetyltransferase
MSWKPASRRDLAGILRLILEDEALCVSFSARIKDQDKGSTLFVNGGPNGETCECFLYTSYGLMLPVLPHGRDAGEMRNLVMNLKPMVHSIMGVAEWVNRAEETLPLPPTTRIEYHLMSLGRRDIAPCTPRIPGVRIRRATAEDADALFPLQRCYEHEEVVVDPTLFSDTQCMRLLKRSLRTELIYLAEKDGAPLAKAGTNARGYDVDQIGGVYTAVSHRREGLAEDVMTALLAKVFQEKSAACLFVKKANAGAIALYRKLDFKIVADYAISYYGI